MASLQEGQVTRFIAITEGRRFVPATPELFLEFVLYINNPQKRVCGFRDSLSLYYITSGITLRSFKKKQPKSSTGLFGNSDQ